MAYADYTYYKDIYLGTMPEEDYKRLSQQASAYIDNITFGRASKNQPEKILSKIKDACCAVSDVLHQKQSGGEIVAQRVGSWSKEFASSGKTSEQKQYEAAHMYLAMTGLMYQGGYNV